MGRAGQPELLQHLSGPHRVKRGPAQGLKSQEEAEQSWDTLPSKAKQQTGRWVWSPRASQQCGFCNQHITNTLIIEHITSLCFKTDLFPLQVLSGRWQRSTNQGKRLEGCSPPESKRQEAGQAAAGRKDISVISAAATLRL